MGLLALRQALLGRRMIAERPRCRFEMKGKARWSGRMGGNMGIVYYEQDRIFKLDTLRTSYLIGVVDEEGVLGHIYYGKKVSGHALGYLLRTGEPPFVPSRNERDRLSFLDKFPIRRLRNARIPHKYGIFFVIK